MSGHVAGEFLDAEFPQLLLCVVHVAQDDVPLRSRCSLVDVLVRLRDRSGGAQQRARVHVAQVPVHAAYDCIYALHGALRAFVVQVVVDAPAGFRAVQFTGAGFVQPVPGLHQGQHFYCSFGLVGAVDERRHAIGEVRVYAVLVLGAHGVLHAMVANKVARKCSARTCEGQKHSTVERARSSLLANYARATDAAYGPPCKKCLRRGTIDALATDVLQ